MKEEYKLFLKEYYEKTNAEKWAVLAEELKNKAYDNCFWLQGPSGYLIKTNKTILGVDPAFTNKNLLEQIKNRIAKDLEVLSFILITHGHGDHFDVDVIKL